MGFIDELRNSVNKNIIDRNERAIKKEEQLIKTIESKDCLSLNDKDILKYGFFHMSNNKNIENILKNGCEARIGENSKGYEKNKRVYFSIGALGVLGILNRAIYLKKQENLKNIAVEKYNIDESIIEENTSYRELKNIFSKEDCETANEKAFIFLNEVLENSEYLLFRINDGIEYELDEIKNNSKIHARNFHTKNNIGIPKEKIERFKINGSSNAKDVFKYFVDNVNIDEVRIGTNSKEFFENEELYLHDFKKYIEKEKELQEKECI